MDSKKKTTENFTQNDKVTVVNGILTSESYHTYEKIRDPKKLFNFPKIITFTTLFVLLTASALLFVYSISKQPNDLVDNDSNTDEKIKIINTKFENNDSFKVENITYEVASVFNIPVGVKIVELNSDTDMYKGLRINDIITDISGEKITCIEDMNTVFEDIYSTQDVLSYTVFRNGVYKTITPFE